MLLVDHDKSKPCKLDVLLYQSMRPNHNVRSPASDILEDFLSEFLALASNQKPEVHGHFCQKRLQRAHMLLCQDFCRGHERHLIAVLHGHKHGHQRNNGLPASDISLQEPVHGMRAAHVPGNLTGDSSLGRGEAEGERIHESPGKLAFNVE